MKLINTKKMLMDAYKGKYAIGAFNINNMEIVQGVLKACEETNSPVILQISPGAIKYAGISYLYNLVEAGIKDSKLKIALNLDHGKDFEICKQCIDEGFTSVMIDGSMLEYEENMDVTRRVVEYAHKYDVTVEGELGRLQGIKETGSIEDNYTNVNQIKEFIDKTGVDSLAIAIGTSHGAFKFSPKQKINLRFDILQEIEKVVPDFPFVLHGASTIPIEFLEKINRYGGEIQNAIGVPDEILKKASGTSICKINVDSDLRLAMTSAIREYFYQHKDAFDPRKYMSYARDSITKLIKHKIQNVFGSENKN